jgi:hypothetical protein
MRFKGGLRRLAMISPYPRTSYFFTQSSNKVPLLPSLGSSIRYPTRILKDTPSYGRTDPLLSF